MMKIFLLFALTLYLSSCRVQLISTEDIIIIPVTKSYLEGVKGPNFQGSIFKENYPDKYFYHAFDSVNRFTPTRQEIAEVETILLNQLPAANNLRPNQGNGNPVIHKNLPKYFRQYVGYTDKQGNRIININFYWNHHSIIDKINDYSSGIDSRLNYDSEYSIFLDGGSYHWQADINLTKKKIMNIGVNGFG